MTTKLLMEYDEGTLDLDSYLQHDRGFQVLSGLTGFGLPPVDVQWQEAAGDGAKFRSRRALPRDIDLPLLLVGTPANPLDLLVDQLSKALAGEVTLRFYPDYDNQPSQSWYVKCHRTGGGSYVYGKDNTSTELIMWLTLRAGDPFWTASNPSTIDSGSGGGTPFLSNMMQLNLTGSQLTGELDIDNYGTADAYPVWKVRGPFTLFRATSLQGEVLEYEYSAGHSIGDEVTFDTQKGTVVDQNGNNLYGRLSPAPKFWAFPPRYVVASVVVEGIDPEQTSLYVEWRPRRWMVV